ncbi:uncharacterized protein LOC142324663 [Lycorma delicatula]|uniref:uncharacterized protein LOC142324663 n=1 Tax=Lycorma delicatula TaxID=130591 RepID=UPI003F511AD9
MSDFQTKFNSTMSCKKAINVVNVGAKTINIAKESLNKGGSFGRPQGGRPQGCHDAPLIPPPPATHIRVCTPEQLRSICPPHPCEPPVIPRPPTTGEKAARGILFLAKILLLLGVIKWTDDLGIWGSTEESRQTANNAYERLSPVFGGGKNDDDSGHSYGVTYNLATMWNNTVSSIIYVVGIFPVVVFRRLFYGKKKENEEAVTEATQNVSLRKTKVKTNRQINIATNEA